MPGGFRTLDEYFRAQPERERAILECYVGEEAPTRLGRFARDELGHRALVVCDENTFAAGGEEVLAALCDAGKTYDLHRFGASPIDPTVELGDEVATAGQACDFFAAVGSGSICDLAKHAGHKLGKPVVLYPTAASMNGYTSGIVAVKVRGLKRTIPCTPAIGVFADPRAAATAPRRMAAAGIADFLSKASSATDWRVGHALRGGSFSDEPRRLFEGTQERVLCAAQRIGRGEIEAYATVLDALMLSGYSMVIAGSSAPASGGEHLISHYVDMKSALYGTPHDLHGTQVGVATLHCLRLWERILALDPADIDVDACVAAQPPEGQIDHWIDEDWGGEVSQEVRAQWREKRLAPDALRAEIELFRWQLLANREEWGKDLLSSVVVEKAIAGAGGPVTPEAMHAPLGVYTKALERARFIRNRFTVLDMAAELALR